MILFPNAKVNLGLDILRRRPDGYHDIDTVMVPVPWCDVLEIVPAEGSDTTLTVSGRHVDCPAEKNLVMKAFRALEREYGLPPVDIYLRKVIPDGAGLGGGSADAAFTLKGLDSMFGLGLGHERLAAIASALGADCPFFICNRPMHCTGTGTDMQPVDIDLRGLDILIVKPPVHVPTAAAYAGTHPQVPAVTAGETAAGEPAARWQGRLKNDFEPSVLAAYPAVARVKDTMAALRPLYCSMSGSGSAVYGLWERDKMSAEAQALFHGCDTFAARLG